MKHRILQDLRVELTDEFDNIGGGLKASHVGHNFDKKGGQYEKHVQNAGYKAGYAVVFENEYSTVIGQRFTEGTWDVKEFEVAGRETETANNILRGLKHCAAKKKNKIAVLDFPNANFDKSTFDTPLARYNGLEKLNNGQFVRFDRIICVQNEEIVLDIEHQKRGTGGSNLSAGTPPALQKYCFCFKYQNF